MTIRSGFPTRLDQGGGLNRCDGLLSQCFFAARPGWERGRNFSTNLGPTDDIRNRKGTWHGTLDSTIYLGTKTGGVGIDSGAGVAADVDWPNQKALGSNVTIAALVAGDDFANDRCIFAIKEDTTAATPGIWLGNGATTNFQLKVSDGTTQEVLVSPGGGRGVGDRTWQLVVGQWTNSPAAFARLTVDTVITSAGSAITTANLGTPPRLRIFQSGQYDGSVAMVAAWNRGLNRGEVMRLFADPFVMWRTDLHKEFMGFNLGKAGAVGGLGSYFLSF